MHKQSIRDADVANKRVLVRVDFNVPLHDGAITDDTRICASLPTITDLLDRKAAVILVSHLGRPKGKPSDDLRLAPVAERLTELLDRPVKTVSTVVSPEVETAVRELRPGEALLLENVRFEPGEEKNDPELARKLARLADLYVNDAFGAAHRAHASTVGVAAHLPAYAGLLMEAELDALARLLEAPDRPYLAILGGAKVSEKIGVISNLLGRIDGLLVGGGMANTFLLAQGHEIGASLAERDFTEQARQLIETAKERGVTFLTPIDVVVAEGLDGEPTTVNIDAVAASNAIFDIGEQTIGQFATEIGRARTIFWNGPMGVFERSSFAEGTRAVARAVGDADAFSVVGGGDSVAAIEQMSLADRISHISTGGGASLEFVEGRELPGVAALLDAEEGETA